MDRRTDVGSAPGDAALSCTVESEYPVAVIHIVGRLDPTGLPELQTCLHCCLAAEPEAVVLEVADLTVTADECATAFVSLSCEAMTWPGSPVVFACAPPALVAAVRRRGKEIASYPSVDAARDRVASGGSRYRLREALPASPVAAPAARRLLGRACRSWSVQELLEPAELVATELVANAVRHAGSRVVLTVSLRQGDLQISVGDDSPALPRQRTASPADEHGRGLFMVDALCKDWGMTCVGNGKVVWARVSAGFT
ncbi:ATP-binding protein [Planosporangium flavigriseum]|uniref:Anti-anti-sigma factor n=1 Tax=Planosporangium flavigriseum TaxID=373681 RepID=A0A8J3PMT5_9ACTN|nr:ATP-binding protein [Planosporangium flavigriseum]NJC66401.1 ATP-binding protein [Planosporangium flavigriseum]GIG74193.1 anti-anti-sigma factor [Planosporangium flavigriseum]